jgi:proteasome lid subunit RPN8/RPN11
MKTNEEYLALLGGIVGNYWWGIGQWGKEGSPGHVDFDYNLVLKQEEENKNVIGFFHTHPMSFASPSTTDYDTMGAWTVCFGKPLVCCIKGINGHKAHWFIDDEKEHVTGWARRFGNIWVGRVPSIVRLKLKEKKGAK